MRARPVCLVLSLALRFTHLLGASSLFNFESATPGTTTGFIDTVNGVSATFISSLPGGFAVNAVSNIGTLRTLQGQALSEPGPLGLDNLPLSITFSQLIGSLTLNFAVIVQCHCRYTTSFQELAARSGKVMRPIQSCQGTRSLKDY